MNRPTNGGGGCCFAALVAVLVLAAGWWQWYRAGVQQEVYHRQGVEMSRWEIMMGAQPVERSIRNAP